LKSDFNHMGQFRYNHKDIKAFEMLGISVGTKWEKISSKLDNMKAERYFNLIELTRENLMRNFDNIEYQFLGD